VSTPQAIEYLNALSLRLGQSDFLIAESLPADVGEFNSIGICDRTSPIYPEMRSSISTGKTLEETENNIADSSGNCIAICY
jgi:hypothetical protein